jgi:hypothetical protein
MTIVLNNADQLVLVNKDSARDSHIYYLSQSKNLSSTLLAVASLESRLGIRVNSSITAANYKELANNFAEQSRGRKQDCLVTILTSSTFNDKALQLFIGKVKHRCASVIFKLININSDMDEEEVDGLIIVIEKEFIKLHNKVDFASKGSSRKYSVVSEILPKYIPRNVSTWWIFPKVKHGIMSSNFDLLDIESKREILLILDSENLQKPAFEKEFWLKTFSASLRDIKLIDDELKHSEYQPFNSLKSETLFVFPERLLPLKRAFFVRGFDVISSLNYAGLPTDILLFGPSNKDLDKINTHLKCVAPKVFTYPLVKGKFSHTHRLARGIEKVLRRANGEISPPPMRFNERQMIFSSSSQIKAIKKTILDGNYSNVIITGAWFITAFKDVMREFPNINFICDTHDNFFVLDQDTNQNESRFLYSARRQKNREISALNSIDLVMPISLSDEINLQKTGEINAYTLVESGSFEYAMSDIEAIDTETLTFGFVGSRNKNNQKCIEKLLDDWWPSIARKLPEAKLRLAGTICETDIAKELASQYSNVEMIGFVDNIATFYKSVHALLSPILVQGGLNFKSVEALMAGKHLITNELGSRCVGDTEGVWVVHNDDIDTVLDELLKVVDNVDYLHEIQNSAMNVYGNKAAYAGLIEWVNKSKKLESKQSISSKGVTDLLRHLSKYLVRSD